MYQSCLTLSDSMRADAFVSQGVRRRGVTWQEMIQEAMGRKANKTMVQDEISKVHANCQKLSETTDKLLRHKAELRDLIKLQKDLQDLAHIQVPSCVDIDQGHKLRRS